MISFAFCTQKVIDSLPTFMYPMGSFKPQRRSKVEAEGKIFGAWKALGPKHENKGCYWLCRCECGTEKWIFIGNLTSGKSKSCGCKKRKVLSEKNSTHGLSKHTMYKIWKGMRQRCLNPNNHAYE